MLRLGLVFFFACALVPGSWGEFVPGAKQDLKDKVAVIVGASGGIGETMSREYAKAGLKVVMGSRSPAKLAGVVKDIKAAGGIAEATRIDVESDASVEAGFKFAIETFGGVDFVLHNAGWHGDDCNKVPLNTMKDTSFQKLFDTNSVGVLRMLKHATLAMGSKGGKILITSGVESVANAAVFGIPSPPGMPQGALIPVAASRAAVNMMIRGSNAAYASSGIHVYGLNYAVFYTPEVARLGAEMGMEDITSFAGFNPIFKTKLGSVQEHLVPAHLALLDGSTHWKPGTNICFDNDVSFDSHFFYEVIERPGKPENLGWPSKDELKPHLKDLLGKPYPLKEEL